MSRNSGPVPLVIVLFISMMLTGCDTPPPAWHTTRAGGWSGDAQAPFPAGYN